MSFRNISQIFLMLIIVLISIESQANTTTKSSITPETGFLPFYFEKNHGQFDPRFEFIAHTSNSFFAFDQQKVFINLSAQNKATLPLMLQFPGGEATQLIGKQKRINKVNYLRGKASQWITHVDTYSKIEYPDLYPGIDLQFYFNPTQLEYDFIVQPGSDPSQIRMLFKAADKLKLNEQGDLVVLTNGQQFLQRAPIIYQQIDGKRHDVSGKYVVKDKLVSLLLGTYDQSKALIIDPIIDFSSYYGGDWEDQSNAIQADSNGNVWVVGSTAAKARITHKNIMTLEHTAMAVANDPDTDHYYEPQHGISLDESFKFDENTQNGAYADLEKDKKITVVNGVEQSEDFIYNCDYEWSGNFDRDRLITDYDGFVSKFSSDMVLIFTSYFGGCRNDGIRSLAIDTNDDVYIAGFTLSDDLPILSASQSVLATSRFITAPVQADAFYAKFANDGALIYASYLGGDGRDGARDIAVDDQGYLYITGYTHSQNLSTTPCADVGIKAFECDYIGGIDETDNTTGTIEESIFSDAFIAKVAPKGDVLVFLSYFGGRYDDWGQSIALQEDGVVIAGNTASANLPSVDGFYSFMAYNKNFAPEDPAQEEQPCTRLKSEEYINLRLADAHVCEDAFLAKFSLDGSQLLFSTFLGGAKDDNVTEMDIDSNGNIYLIGTTRSQGARLATGEIGEGENDPVIAVRFPLFKNLNEFEFEVDSLSTIAFFTVFNPDASQLLLSSFIGGESDDAGIGLSINELTFDGDQLQTADVYLGGHSISKNFYTSNAFQHISAASDVFLVKLALDVSKFYEPFSLDTNLGGCNKDQCDLYDIAYSTLFGGEDLDSLKDLSFMKSHNALMFTGTTYSTHLPITDNANKSSITEVTEIEYAPVTREIDDQFQYFPSDGFIVSFKESDSYTDLQLTLDIPNKDNAREGDVLQYNLLAKNISAVTAQKVRLQVQFPYLSTLERLNSFVSIDITECVLRINLLLCELEDLLPDEEKNISLKIQPTSDGAFAVDLSLLAQTADQETSNNTVNSIVNVADKVHRSALAGLLVFYFFLMGFLRYVKAWRPEAV